MPPSPTIAKVPGIFQFIGPDLPITSGAVIALAMTFNELCTNTTKFGALSVPAGGVDIGWLVDDEKKRLCLTWQEKGGPAVASANSAKFRDAHDEVAGTAVEG